MRIVHIVPGSGGGFYCQNCVRDVGLVKALHRAGHDVLFVPMYLPFMELTDEPVPLAPVFYGAVNVYLDQKLPFYRRLPAAWRRRLDTPRVLRWAAGKAGTTQAGGLGPMTLSVLEGHDGRQRIELDRMVAWLKTQPRPDIVHFSNALLLGLAPAMREALGARIVCTLQDEDIWLDVLPSPWRERCWTRIRDLAAEVDCFVTVSHTYAAMIRPRLSLSDWQCRIIPLGIDTDVFTPAPKYPDKPTIGFLSELSPAYGLDLLVDATTELRRRPDLAGLTCRITGGRLDQPSAYLKRIQAGLATAGQANGVEFVDAYRDGQRAGFLRSLTVLSVPARRSEAFGLFLIEAMACGVPVVQPRIGAYPEVVEATGGGVIYDDPTPSGLAQALYPLLSDPARVANLGLSGRAAVVEHFSLPRLVADMTSLYQAVKTGK